MSQQTPRWLLPAVIAVVLQWIMWFGLRLVAPELAVWGMLGGLIVALVIVVWWLFLSRAPWSERLAVIVLAVVAVIAIRPLIDESVIGGAMGRLQPIASIPTMCLAIVAWASLRSRFAGVARWAAMAAVMLAGAALVTLLRSDGVQDGGFQWQWRWTLTAEEKLLAATATEKDPEPATAPVVVPEPAKPAAGATLAASDPAPAPSLPATPAEWPGFRGASRDDVVRGLKIATDWTKRPPVELWRRAVGPGWSSFAVHGDLIFTQEQRGEDEVVSGYRLSTGAPVWKHRDRARFYESNGGPGPRGTPAVAHGRVYAIGATGIVNALDERTGRAIWKRNAVDDTGATIPGWGITSSPLVLGDLVIVAASGRLAAYDAATGELRWKAPPRGGGYASPHLATIAGVEQILFQNGSGLTSYSPADGTVLWQYDWEGSAMLQPIVATATDVLVTSGDMMGGMGTRRISVENADGWKVQEKWASRNLKPYFNDIVAHNGFAYGFDGNILACIDLNDGTRKWKGGRYGNGQLVLLADDDVLLVLSEEGDLALVKAAPDQFTELARFPAIEGKTWNHLVVVGDVLLVRNGEEMAAFRLPR